MHNIRTTDQLLLVPIASHLSVGNCFSIHTVRVLGFYSLMVMSKQIGSRFCYDLERCLWHIVRGGVILITAITAARCRISCAEAIVTIYVMKSLMWWYTDS